MWRNWKTLLTWALSLSIFSATHRFRRTWQWRGTMYSVLPHLRLILLPRPRDLFSRSSSLMTGRPMVQSSQRLLASVLSGSVSRPRRKMKNWLSTRRSTFTPTTSTRRWRDFADGTPERARDTRPPVFPGGNAGYRGRHDGSYRGYPFLTRRFAADLG